MNFTLHSRTLVDPRASLLIMMASVFPLAQPTFQWALPDLSMLPWKKLRVTRHRSSTTT
jgi:hypothetical protein